MKKNTNVIFIAIDALRAQNLSCYGHRREVSPHIDELARKGLLFENAYTCINYTDPSFTTIFSGKYPLTHGILNHGPRVTDVEVRRFDALGIKLLPEILKLNGYTTLAIDWLWRWHKRGYDYYSGAKAQSSLHGFVKQQVRKFPVLRKIIRQSVVARIGEKVFKVSKAYEDAKSVTDQAIRLIKENRDGPFFLFLHYWDTHSPYLPPREHVSQYLNTEKKMRELFRFFTDANFRDKFDSFEEKVLQYEQEIAASYDGEISYADREIGRLVDYLRSCQMLESSLIVLTSDHGESLVEHGIYLDHHGLYDETIHVPLILLHPELPRGMRIGGLVQHFDIVPTVLDLMDVKIDGDFDGRSVLPLIDGEELHSAVYVEEAQWERKRAMRTNRWKYIHALSEKDAECKRCGRMHGAMEELYDLLTDPKEEKNVLKQHPEIVVELRNRLEDWVKRLDYERLPAEETGKSYEEDMEKVEERLKGLGYIS